MSDPLLRVTNLKKYFPVVGGLLSREVGRVHAVDGVSFTIGRGETLGLVGESGCGKSTTGRCVLRLIEPTAGGIAFEGQDVLGAGGNELRALRRKMQIVFQDPFASLNPRMTIGAILGEALIIHELASSLKEREDRVASLLVKVGLKSEHMRRYPHEFSGGQRQRIGLARALMLKPDVLIADEPVSALDVTVQAQVLDLLDKVRRQMNLAMLFITHDMRVAARICHRVMVMRQGQVVEEGPTGALFAAPRNEYTGRLLAAIPGRQRLEA